jgi:hypothetical protein
MGFHLELFIDPVDESLKCDLCHSVYRDPVITSCDHVYCEQCLKEWLVNRTECPKSCKQISFERDVTRLFPLQILVEKLRTHCVNFTEGCEVVTTLSEMLAHLEVCDYTKKDIGVTRKTCSSEQLSAPEVNSLNQVFVCNKGCGLPLLFQDSTEHDCVKSLQAQVSSLQTKLTRSEHEREKVAARLVKREEAMQERFTQLERDLRSYQEQTLNYELHSRDQRSQINYLKKQLDSRGSDQVSFYSLLIYHYQPYYTRFSGHTTSQTLCRLRSCLNSVPCIHQAGTGIKRARYIGSTTYVASIQNSNSYLDMDIFIHGLCFAVWIKV